MEKRVQDYTSEILEVVKSNASPAVLCQRLQDYHENDIADILEKLSPAERCKLYRILDMDTISDIFEYTEEADVVKYLEEMNIRKAAAILSKMDTNVLSDVLQQFDRSKRKIFIELLDDEVRHDIEMINSFDEDEIGSRMTTNYIVIHENLTVKEAMTELVSQAAKNDNISTIFVITASEEFYGAIDLKDLIIARRDHPLEELIVTSYPYVYGTDLIDECIEDLKDYSEDSIPVLDNDNRLLGVITSANIVDLVDDEMGDDYAKLAGLTAEEDLNEPLRESMKKRMPWLVILLALGMIVSSVVGIFEKVVTNLPIIMCFQSLILDMAGNGGVLGLMSFALIGLYIYIIKGKTLIFAYAVSGCIGLSLLLAMLISSAVGTCIPLFFKKIHIDPAVASGPLITTINDLVAVISYYGLSWIFLIEVLHLAG